MATLSRLMKKAASSVIPLANRTNPLRKYTTAITSSTSIRQVFRRTSIPTNRHFSALSHKRTNTEEEVDDLKVLEAPKNFPFKIEDNPEERCISLTREYQGEEIEVVVHWPEYHGDYSFHDDSDDEEEEEDREEESDPPIVPLHISVRKKNGLTFTFSGAANAHGLSIWMVDYLDSDGYSAASKPDFWEFGENLQKAFYKYLEVRGIENSIGEFLCDYMVQKAQEYTSSG